MESDLSYGLNFQGGDVKNMIISDQIKAKWLDYWFGEFKKSMKISLTVSSKFKIYSLI